jgi:hypothetical protein
MRRDFHLRLTPLMVDTRQAYSFWQRKAVASDLVVPTFTKKRKDGPATRPPVQVRIGNLAPMKVCRLVCRAAYQQNIVAVPWPCRTSGCKIAKGHGCSWASVYNLLRDKN